MIRSTPPPDSSPQLPSTPAYDGKTMDGCSDSRLPEKLKSATSGVASTCTKVGSTSVPDDTSVAGGQSHCTVGENSSPATRRWQVALKPPRGPVPYGMQ